MKAVVYREPRHVSVDDVPDARIEKSAVFEPGSIFGHENVTP